MSAPQHIFIVGMAQFLAGTEQNKADAENAVRAAAKSAAPFAFRKGASTLSKLQALLSATMAQFGGLAKLFAAAVFRDR